MRITRARRNFEFRFSGIEIWAWAKGIFLVYHHISLNSAIGELPYSGKARTSPSIARRLTKRSGNGNAKRELDDPTRKPRTVIYNTIGPQNNECEQSDDMRRQKQVASRWWPFPPRSRQNLKRQTLRQPLHPSIYFLCSWPFPLAKSSCFSDTSRKKSRFISEH